MKKILLLAIYSITVLTLKAQQVPFSFNRETLNQRIPVKTMPTVDAVPLLAEDALNINNKEIPYRFGFKHDVDFGIDNSGLKQTLLDGSLLWRIDIRCPDAFSVNLILDKFSVPEGAQLYLYSADKSYVVGPYTSKNNNEANKLGTDLVKGEEIVVEYYEPKYVAFHGELHISNVTHAYKDPFKAAASLGESGSCHNNTICPLAIDWQDDKRAVAVLLVGGNAFCSGAMLGDVAMDGTPYFLTANHCSTSNDWATWVFRFNYESPTCTPSTEGPMNFNVSGSTLKARTTNSDFCLVQLNQQPDPLYFVYYAGWSNLDVASTSSVGIHHPMGDVKKISFDNGASVSANYAGGGANSHWSVNWDSGVTEGGSSGSPLFDQNHRVIGQLHGGPSGCGNTDLHDYYGKFAKSWNGGGTSSTRLKDWLDAGNTNATVLNGYYFGLPTDTLNISLQNIQTPTASYCSGDSITPVIDVKNVSLDTITNFVITYTIDGINPINYNWSGAISLFGIKNISLPSFLASNGNHTIEIKISNPNGAADQDTTNNFSSHAFSVIDGHHINVQIKN